MWLSRALCTHGQTGDYPATNSPYRMNADIFFFLWANPFRESLSRTVRMRFSVFSLYYACFPGRARSQYSLLPSRRKCFRHFVTTVGVIPTCDEIISRELPAVYKRIILALSARCLYACHFRTQLSSTCFWPSFSVTLIGVLISLSLFAVVTANN